MGNHSWWHQGSLPATNKQPVWLLLVSFCRAGVAAGDGDTLLNMQLAKDPTQETVLPPLFAPTGTFWSRGNSQKYDLMLWSSETLRC